MSKTENLKKSSHGFGNGQDNPDGLHLKFEVSPELAKAIINIDGKFQGWPGIAHGGIIATCLDEAMGHAVGGALGSYSMTAELEVFYLAPTKTNEELLLTGRVVSVEGRKVSALGELRRAADNELLARGKALYILVTGREEDL